MDYVVVSKDGFVLQTACITTACKEFVVQACDEAEEHVRFTLMRDVEGTEFIVARRHADNELRLYGVSWAQWRQLSSDFGRRLN